MKHSSAPNLVKQLIGRIRRTDIAQKFRFLGASGLSTAVDYSVFFSALTFGVTLVPSQLMAQASGFITNFLLQRNWVFKLGRNNLHVLMRLGITVPVGLTLGAGTVYLLAYIPVMYENKILLKIITTAILFTYNYYSRRWVFEKKDAGQPSL
jgi:putative flippase GtrA